MGGGGALSESNVRLEFGLRQMLLFALCNSHKLERRKSNRSYHINEILLTFEFTNSRSLLLCLKLNPLTLLNTISKQNQMEETLMLLILIHPTYAYSI